MAGNVKRGLDSAELSSFCSQVALILSAGLPLYDGMETLAETTRGSEHADLYENVSKAVNETGSLYKALQRDDRWPTYRQLSGRTGTRGHHQGAREGQALCGRR